MLLDLNVGSVRVGRAYPSPRLLGALRSGPCLGTGRLTPREVLPTDSSKAWAVVPQTRGALEEEAPRVVRDRWGRRDRRIPCRLRVVDCPAGRRRPRAACLASASAGGARGPSAGAEFRRGIPAPPVPPSVRRPTARPPARPASARAVTKRVVDDLGAGCSAGKSGARRPRAPRRLRSGPPVRAAALLWTWSAPEAGAADAGHGRSGSSLAERGSPGAPETERPGMDPSSTCSAPIGAANPATRQRPRCRGPRQRRERDGAGGGGRTWLNFN